MKNNKICVGLDIGTTKIVALVGKKNEYDKIEILGYGKSKSQGVHRGVVNNITQTIQSIQLAIEDAKISSGHEIFSPCLASNVHMNLLASRRLSCVPVSSQANPLPSF